MVIKEMEIGFSEKYFSLVKIVPAFHKSLMTELMISSGRLKATARLQESSKAFIDSNDPNRKEKYKKMLEHIAGKMGVFEKKPEKFDYSIEIGLNSKDE